MRHDVNCPDGRAYLIHPKDIEQRSRMLEYSKRENMKLYGRNDLFVGNLGWDKPMNIKEQIAALPDGLIIRGALVSTEWDDEIVATDLKALADSHTRLLEAAKDVQNLVGLGVNEAATGGSKESELFDAIEEAKQL